MATILTPFFSDKILSVARPMRPKPLMAMFI